MKSCPACKKEVDDNASECLYCGVIFEKWRTRIARTDTGPLNVLPTPSATNATSAYFVESSMEPVGFMVRSGALFIDGFVVIIISKPFQLLFSAAGLPKPGLMTLFISLMYYTWTVGAWGQTLGKKIAGIKIIKTDGTDLDYTRSFFRALARGLSGLIIGLGYLMVFLNPLKQAMHDVLLNTRVVYLPDTSYERRRVMTFIGTLPFVLLVGMLFLFSVLLNGGHPDASKKIASMLGMISGNTHKSDRLIRSVTRNQEDEDIGKLMKLHDQIGTYYVANYHWPSTLNELEASGKFPPLPMLNLGDHPPSNDVENYSDDICVGHTKVDPSKLRDSGKWGYAANPDSKCAGLVFVDCTHADTKGKHPYEW